MNADARQLSYAMTRELALDLWRADPKLNAIECYSLIEKHGKPAIPRPRFVRGMAASVRQQIRDERTDWTGAPFPETMAPELPPGVEPELVEAELALEWTEIPDEELEIQRRLVGDVIEQRVRHKRPPEHPSAFIELSIGDEFFRAEELVIGWRVQMDVVVELATVRSLVLEFEGELFEEDQLALDPIDRALTTTLEARRARARADSARRRTP